MAYQSLYRRYRSRRFSEVLGQDQVIGALRNAVRDERVGHAYLFSGPRGTGKTSTARILAKALNCTDLRDGEPCCECEPCLAIEAGTSYDLQELDAASNNKVENVRDLIERVALGSPGRTKVYILDEVHMLSAGASNALLKTLEEPPAHVVFVLATTDPHKVLPTIRSRTQHFEFHLLPADVLADHVRWVIEDAGLDVPADAVEHVLRQGGGSARDTLSALDQVAASGTVDAHADQAEALVDAVCEADTGLALRAVAEAVAAGRDPRTLGESLLSRLRDVFLCRMGAPLDHLGADDRERVTAWAGRIGDRATTRALEEVGAALLEMRQAPDPRIPLEVALVRLTRPEAGGDLDALVVRVERLERALAQGAATPTGEDARTTTPSTVMPGADEPPPVPPSPATRPGDAAREALARPPAPPADPAPPPASSAVPSPAPSDVPVPAGVMAPAAPEDPGDTPPSAPPPGPSQAPADASPSASPPARLGEDTPPARPSAAAPESAPSPAGLPDRDALTLGWADAVLPRLGGLTKAMFAGGRFVDTDGGRATFALPNEVHRRRCEQKRAEVEAALAEHFGRPVPLRLTIDGSAQSVADPPLATPTAEADEDLGLADVADLEDAPADPTTGFSRLTEAFPGAQLLEEDTR